MRQQAGFDRPKSKKPASPKRLLLWTLFAGVIIGLLGLAKPVDFIAQTTWAGLNHHPASDNIVIVKIDDASLRKVGNDVTPNLHPAVTRVRTLLSRVSAGEAMACTRAKAAFFVPAILE